MLKGLRGLAVIPQDDRMILDIDPSLGCRTFADIRAKKPKLKIILSPDNGDGLIGYCAHKLLEAHNVPVELIKFMGRISCGCDQA